MHFRTFKTAVAAQFARLSAFPLFVTAVEKGTLWATYLSSFPEGANPIFRERTEHDCSCCRQFIRNIGNVVAIVDGQLESIWDVQMPGEPEYQAVADALAALVKSQPIDNLFLHPEKTVGTDKNFEQMVDHIQTWEHFFVHLPPACVMKEPDIGPVAGEARAKHDVLWRSLTEIADDAVTTVLDLIAQNSLYRGAEFKFMVEEFQKLKWAFKHLVAVEDRDLFAWLRSREVPASVSKIRNTSIGVLLTDLSEGMEMEDAVKRFEAMVAPANYKRPTALVTPKMIAAAKQTIADLGLTSALERRYATIHDITINNVLFADRSTRKVMQGDVFDTLAAGAVQAKPKNLDKVEEVPIERFLADILPRAESIEIQVENRHATNFVSLVAPVDPTAKGLFKWGNNFSWSYNGDMADSIKKRVKAAGGNVTGELCCRLAWDYSDDLDFHMEEPDGHTIYFGNRRSVSRCGGMLDVDANGMDGIRDNPVENIFYERLASMQEGPYTLKVNNYNRRSTGVGFEVEIDIQGTVHRMDYDKVLRDNYTVTVAVLSYSKAAGLEIVESLPSSMASRTVWNVPTQTFQKVSALMMSPNFWDGQLGIGNKHYFFMLENCRNDGTARPFFNEYLKSELNTHRKVLEMVGAKLHTEQSDEQLSGLGFSSTQRNNVLCRVKGSFTRLINITF